MSLHGSLADIGATHSMPEVIVEAVHASVALFSAREPLTFRALCGQLGDKSIDPKSPEAEALQVWGFGTLEGDHFTMPAVMEDIIRYVDDALDGERLW